MRTIRIHTGQTLAPGQSLELEPGPSQHIARALRMQPGDSLVLFDGNGGQYPAVISAVTKKAVVATTGTFEAIELESALALQLGIALSRGDRMDWVVQKATELGVHCIAPLLSERSEVRLKGDRQDKKLRHWQQIAISACEQCGRNRVPRILAPQDLANWVTTVQAQMKLVLHPLAADSPPNAIAPDSIALLIGPEGGLASAEVETATLAGFSPLKLGPRVLRTETAPLAAIAILQARWGDM
jgi:16S rRNA (uracil1498-N3)-methyltransferase